MRGEDTAPYRATHHATQEYPTVAEAVAAANGNPIRLLWKASWKPTAADLGQPVKFLNKSRLNLDLSGLPANVRAVWTDVDGNSGTLTLELYYADTVVYGTIRTAEEGNPLAEAIAIKDGVTEIVDHRGKGMVMPGCTDGHSHYTMHFALPKMKGGVMLAKSDDKTAILKMLEAGERGESRREKLHFRLRLGFLQHQAGRPAAPG